MADVRLTATNPEDSSVVPVACTAAGLLRVEPQVQGPQGEPGPRGPAGPAGQDGQDGDPFTGQFSGNVNFDSPDLDGPLFLSNRGSGSLSAHRQGEGPHINFQLRRGDGARNDCAHIKAVAEGDLGSSWPTGMTFGLRRFESDITDLMHLSSQGNLGIRTLEPDAPLDVNGGVRFAGNKAGFTAEGYLWCTTRRGDVVILDATSNGIGSWVTYVPPQTTEIDGISDVFDS